MSAAPLCIINQSEALSLAFSPVLKHLLILYVFFISDRGEKKKKREALSLYLSAVLCKINSSGCDMVVRKTIEKFSVYKPLARAYRVLQKQWEDITMCLTLLLE